MSPRAIGAGTIPAAPSRAAWRLWQLTLTAVGTALALTAACPPYALAWLDWLALVLLLRAAWSVTPAQAFVLGTATSWLHLAAIGGWLVETGMHAGAFALGDLYSSLYFGAFTGFAAWCHRRDVAFEPLVLGAVFAGLEWLRASMGWLGVTWGQLGYTQQALPAVAQLAGALGIYGVSFALVAVNAAIAGLWESPRHPARRRRAWREAGAVAGAALALFAAAQLRFGVGAPARLRIGIVQAGVYDPRSDPPARAAELLQQYWALTREAARERPDLIVWPESAVPATVVLPQVEGLARELGTDLLVAASGRDKTSPAGSTAMRANSAFLVSAHGAPLARYDKIRLLPFNEFLPWRSWFPWPRWIAPEFTDAEPGRERTRFELKGVRFSVLICWENLFAEHFQQSARDVDLMLSLTNEAFTGGDAVARGLLLQWNAMRAPENGVPIVRVGTTGTSGFIAPDGSLRRRVGSGAASETGWLVDDLVVPRSHTLYGRFGDASLGVLALALLPLFRATPMSQGHP